MPTPFKNRSGKDYSQGTLVKKDTILPVVSSSINDETTEEKHLQELAQTLVEFKLASISQVDYQNRLIKQLMGKVRWLIAGWILSVSILGGAGSWAIYHLSGEQHKSMAEILYLQKSKADLGKFDQLTDKVEQFSDSVPENLNQEWKIHREQLETLQQQLATLSSETEAMTYQLSERQEAIAVLAKALGELFTKEGMVSESLNVLPLNPPQISAADDLPSSVKLELDSNLER